PGSVISTCDVPLSAPSASPSRSVDGQPTPARPLHAPRFERRFDSQPCGAQVEARKPGDEKNAREAREVTNSDHGAARRASGGAARGCARITLCPGAIIPADPLGKTPAIARRAMRARPLGPVAQLAEQQTLNLRVVGSIP